MTKIRNLFMLIKIVSRELTMMTTMFFINTLLYANFNRLTEKCYALLVYIWPNQKADILCRLGWVYERHNNIDRAISCFNEALELKPNDAMNYFYLGTLHELKGNKSHAIDYYKHALNLGVDFGSEFKLQLHKKIDQLQQ